MLLITIMNDTIFALATPSGKSGVAVIRISGDDAKSIAGYLGHQKALKPRYAHYATLLHPKTNDVIDYVLLLYFVAPHSFTGEDVLEIHCHGGRAIISELLNVLLNHPSLRYAEAGEFSKRALFNDKMDFLQAEGLLDLIDSETSEQKKLALNHYGGNVSSHYQQLEDAIIETRAFCEVFIDFPDDDLPDDMIEQINSKINGVNLLIQHMLESADHGKQIREGIQVAILGVPNAGKSTLINALTGKDVAITSNEEGTTRDVIEGYKDIDGIPFRFYDTAGIRQTDSSVEMEGIKRASAVAKQANVVFLILDPFLPFEEQYKLLKPYVSHETVLIVNKADLSSEGYQYQKEISYVSHETFLVSAKTGVGLDALINQLRIYANSHNNQDLYVCRERHMNHLIDSMGFLCSAMNENDLVIKSEHLIRASKEIGCILGKINLETILDKLFSDFCIGK